MVGAINSCVFLFVVNVLISSMEIRKERLWRNKVTNDLNTQKIRTLGVMCYKPSGLSSCIVYLYILNTWVKSVLAVQASFHDLIAFLYILSLFLIFFILLGPLYNSVKQKVQIQISGFTFQIFLLQRIFFSHCDTRLRIQGSR